MKYKAPCQCPICGEELSVAKLSCFRCKTNIEGQFTINKFSRLQEEQLEFIEIFIKCRGNIKDVEKEMCISYPTVRNKLEGVIQALGYSLERYDNTEEKKLSQSSTEKKQVILDALGKGEITPQDAAQQLRKLNKK